MIFMIIHYTVIFYYKVYNCDANSVQISLVIITYSLKLSFPYSIINNNNKNNNNKIYRFKVYPGCGRKNFDDEKNVSYMRPKTSNIFKNTSLHLYTRI